MCNGGLADGEFEAPRKCTEFAVLGCEQCPGPDNVYVGASVLMSMSKSMPGRERLRQREQRFGFNDTLEPESESSGVCWVFGCLSTVGNESKGRMCHANQPVR